MKIKHLEMVGISLLLLLFSVLIPGCQTTDESNDQDTGKMWGEISNGIRCSIVVESINWSNGDPAVVSVTVENASEGRADLKTIPAFTLNEMQYWCPVNVVGDDYNLPANARSEISLEKGAQINLVIDISKLGWDSGFSSVWPSKNLYSIVPVGKYSLRLALRQHLRRDLHPGTAAELSFPSGTIRIQPVQESTLKFTCTLQRAVFWADAHCCHRQNGSAGDPIDLAAGYRCRLLPRENRQPDSGHRHSRSL